MREKIGKSRFTVFFQWFVAPEGRKVGSLKRRVRSQLARWDMKKCTPLWREAHFQVKMDKTLEERTTFGSCDVEKVHAVVARSTFWSQNVQNTPWSDHFWKLRCRKSARRCGAKHISKSKCTKHHMFAPLLEVRMLEKCTPLWREAHFQVKMHKAHHVRTTFGVWDVEFWKSARRCGAKHSSKSKCTKHYMFAPLLEVQMSKKCTPLWREAHFQVKMYKMLHVRATFGGSDVEKVHAVVARSTFPSQNVQNATCSRHFWRFRCRFTTLHYTTLHSTTLHYTTLHYTTLQLQLHNYTPLHSTTLNYTTLHYITLHSTTLNYITLHCTTFHYTKLHYTTLHYTTTTTTQLHSTTIHSTTLHYTKLHYTTLHYTTLHSTTLHYTTLPSTTLHYITLHYTPLHYNYNYDYTTTLHYTPLHEITLHYTTLHYTTFHYTPLHYTTLHYTTLHWMTLHHR